MPIPKPMTELERYIALRKLITLPEHFTQNVYARDGLGQAVPPEAENATCWCVLGGLRRLLDGGYISPAIILELRTACFDLFGIKRVSTVNDHLGHAAILAAIDLVIERLSPPTSAE
jgi:hypothetical protein